MSKGLSPRTAAVLAALRAKAEYAEGEWLAVYLDNAKPSDMSAHAFAGHLGALEKAGLYKPTDGTAWGSVKSNGVVTMEEFPN